MYFNYTKIRYVCSELNIHLLPLILQMTDWGGGGLMKKFGWKFRRGIKKSDLATSKKTAR